MNELIRQSLRFGAVGLVNTAVGLLAIYAIIFFFNSNPAVANAIGYAIGLVLSFTLNRFWTFDSAQSIKKVLPRYLLVAAISYLINLSAVLIGTYHFGEGPYMVQLFGIGIYTVTMFFGCRWFVFYAPTHNNVSLNPQLRGYKLHSLLKVYSFLNQNALKSCFILGVVAITPLLIAMNCMNLWYWDFSIPLDYRVANSDETWQHILTKMVVDTGWILDNPFLGAPDIAHWHNNPAAQTSALHSILMLAISKFVADSVAIQQYYFVVNFSLISLTTFFSCRILGMARFPAYCVSLLFSLLSYRFNHIAYSFIPNYFAVPLGLVSVFWVITGEFSKNFTTAESKSLVAIKKVFSSLQFWKGLFFIVLVTISDGYYAFFVLLLLGFSVFVRIFSGDIRVPASLLVPLVYIVTLLSVALMLAWPISAYKNSHHEEFFPGGVEDPALVRHSFEAEIYSLSLKLLVAPSTKHQIESFSNIGKNMIETSDMARAFKTQIVYVPLGFLGTILFLSAMTVLVVPGYFWASSGKAQYRYLLPEYKIICAASVLAFFIFLCSISGGIGTLIALVYPTIRAYDRFPLFLIFVLYLGGGMAVSVAIRKFDGKKRLLVVGLLLIITILSVLDQLPNNADRTSEETRARFLAERNFVRKIEEKLPFGAMVYQYPYSQWLTDSKYYGWGSFAHVRLYLHSIALRWSNGASKNSFVDNWHYRLSRLPINQLLTEIQGVGFSSVIVDRRVVSSSEYQDLRTELVNRTGVSPIEDESSKLAFFTLNDPGYKLVYDESYQNVTKMIIHDASRLYTNPLPRLINSDALLKLLEADVSKNTWTIEKEAHPEVFLNLTNLDRGLGDNPISPLSDMKGHFECISDPRSTDASSDHSVLMTITNNSEFDWEFNQGRFPIDIGVHILRSDGSMLRWDDGLRLSREQSNKIDDKTISNESLAIPRGRRGQLRFSLSRLSLKEFGEDHQGLIVDFRMVQDGHAWFEHLGCKVMISK